ncbi:MAG: ribosome small subunit-dependent GTPase A [Bacteroidales bacterium]|jgi:ribosome biogenesis GTPase|nr:ribosome small subunit-dependent GTPase A [Bacteroidales bacterium]MDD4830267.1 ribosome small subunit-dependent GTPase A [Bacteroidales bacterium]
MKEGKVIRTTGSHYSVRTNDNQLFECRIKGNFRIKNIKSTNPIAVGDIVDFIPPTQTIEGLITNIHNRKNTLVRRSTNLSKRSQIIASNIDQAFLIATIAFPRTSSGFIDRFLVTTEAHQIPTIIVFNKIDIYNQEAQDFANEFKAIYENVGYRCIEVSAKRGDNIEMLREIMKDKTTLLSGHSGVGKSALINAIDNSLNLKTGIISSTHMKGKHTTTFAEMFPLSFGGDIIDTPGIKEFGMFDFQKEEVGLYYPEMKARLKNCQYYNCTHEHEPKCAIKNAVETGEISIERYTNYLNIMHGEELKIEKWEDK